MTKKNRLVVQQLRRQSERATPKVIRLMVAVEIFEDDEEAFRTAVRGYTPDPTIWRPDTDEWLEAMDPSHSEE